MNILIDTTWQKYIDTTKPNYRCGLRLRIEPEVNWNVKNSIKQFATWLRAKYFFPLRVPVYIKASEKIKALDGEYVSATFFEPINRNDEPYIRIATGDYEELCQEIGEERAIAAILHSFAHEVAHYFQWINAVQLTELGYERQALRYARIILTEYLEESE